MPVHREGENLDESGVIMVESEHVATALLASCKGKAGPLAFVAPRRLLPDLITKIDEICMRCVCDRDGVEEVVLLPAFLHQLGRDPVEHKAKAAPVTVATKTPTLVLRLTVEVGNADEIEEKELRSVVMEHLRTATPDLSDHIIDMWALRHNLQDGTIACLLRSKQEALAMWLAISGIKPTSEGRIWLDTPKEAQDGFELVWIREKDEQPVQHADAVALLGAVKSHKGLIHKWDDKRQRFAYAIRVPRGHGQECKMHLNMESRARYVVTNLPVDISEDQVHAICRTINWSAEAIPGTRRCRKDAASMLLRASDPPSVWAWPLMYGGETRTVQVRSKEAQKEERTTSRAPTARRPTASWMEVHTGKQMPDEQLKQSHESSHANSRRSDSRVRWAAGLEEEEPSHDGEPAAKRLKSPLARATTSPMGLKPADGRIVKLEQQVTQMATQLSELTALLKATATAAAPSAPAAPGADGKAAGAPVATA